MVTCVARLYLLVRKYSSFPRSSAFLASSTTSGLPTTSGSDVRSVSIQSMKSSSRASNGLTGTSMILCSKLPRLPPSFKILLRTHLDRDLSFICV